MGLKKTRVNNLLLLQCSNDGLKTRSTRGIQISIIPNRQFFSQFTDVHIQYSTKLRLYWYQVGSKTCYTLKASKFYVEKDICINKLENVYFMDQKAMQGGLNFEAFEMQKQNMPTDRTQRIEENNGFICLFVMFILRPMIFKMTKMAHCLYVPLFKAKN